MTTLSLFEMEKTETTVTDQTRAYCPQCRDFTVLPTTRRCERCGEGLDRHYDFVEVGDDG